MTEVELLVAIAKSDDLSEQRRLMEDLNRVRAKAAARRQADREIDLANAVIRDTLTPVAVHERNTAATDWLDELPASMGSYDHPMRIEATMWFRKVHPAVKADREEFTEQAQGMARRLASQYGTDAPAARKAFLDEVERLRSLAAGDFPGEVNDEQSGNAESQVTDYDTKTDQDPMWGEDWDGEDDTGSQIGSDQHPGQPGAGESVASRKTALKCSCAHNNDGTVTTMLCPLHADEDPCWTMALVTGKRRKGSIVNGVCTNCGWSGGTTASRKTAVEGQTCPECGKKGSAIAAAGPVGSSKVIYECPEGHTWSGGTTASRKQAGPGTSGSDWQKAYDSYKNRNRSGGTSDWGENYPKKKDEKDEDEGKEASRMPPRKAGNSADYQKGYEDGYKAEWVDGYATTWDESMNGNWDYGDGFNAGTDAQEAERRSQPRGDITVGDGFAAFSDPDDFLDAWLGSKQAAVTQASRKTADSIEEGSCPSCGAGPNEKHDKRCLRGRAEKEKAEKKEGSANSRLAKFRQVVAANLKGNQ